MKQILMVFLLVGFVVSQFKSTTSTTTTKKQGWVRSKVTRFQEFVGIRRKSTTESTPRSRKTTVSRSFIDRVLGRTKTTTTHIPRHSITTTVSPTTRFFDRFTRRKTTVTITTSTIIPTTIPFTSSTRSSFFDRVLGKFRPTITPIPSHFHPINDDGFVTTTTQIVTTTDKSIFSRIFDKIKSAFQNEKVQKYGKKAIEKLSPMVLKKVKDYFANRNKKTEDGNGNRNDKDKNFHGFNSFFSTDEEFPTQLQNFEGNTQRDLKELKAKVERLEKLVEGLQSTILKDWNTTESGSRFKLFEERKNWDEAEKTCQSFGGHLVVVDNDNRNNYVKELLKSSSQTADFAWIGMKTKTTTQTSTFTNFASENPIDGCAVIDKTGVWAIRSCVQLRPFICQIIKIDVNI
ncbi:unnamed protein product [Caenorhabditis angaria]|uniref:C-type lectin domain-containing protein n=1 Tax=Caenorhabditis angaria TaxID=860376 RepID=A0A9P1MVE8_9PELO|nr:unnamed protein product [Caenorhabditis angaria]